MGLEIRLYTRDKAGKLEDLFDADAPFFGTCPMVGDVVTMDRAGSRKPSAFEVVKRYFTISIDGWQGWTVIVEEIKSQEALAVHREHKASSKFWRDFYDREETNATKQAQKLALKGASEQKE